MPVSVDVGSSGHRETDRLVAHDIDDDTETTESVLTLTIGSPARATPGCDRTHDAAGNPLDLPFWCDSNGESAAQREQRSQPRQSSGGGESSPVPNKNYIAIPKRPERTGFQLPNLWPFGELRDASELIYDQQQWGERLGPHRDSQGEGGSGGGSFFDDNAPAPRPEPAPRPPTRRSNNGGGDSPGLIEPGGMFCPPDGQNPACYD